MGRILTEKDVEAAVRGGSVYAAGGGGWADHGRMLGTAAVRIGQPELVSIEELDEDDWVATAAAIGAPASTTPWEMRGVDYIKAVQMLQDALGEKLSGLMVGQNGKSSTLNGWLPSAALGLKVVDAVGDIRAHPTGDMGSIGMAGSPEQMIQTAVGGNREENRPGEKVGIAMSKAFSFALVGGLKKYRPIEARRVAHAMVRVMTESGHRVLQHEDLVALSS